MLLTATQVANAAGVALIGGLYAAALGTAPGTPGTPPSAYAHATVVTTAVVPALAAATGLLARTLADHRA